ncbi:hypothetical protein PENSPDRAFT_755010 [Peniophora sp. CONT]|nr:hypothetical protein PENSPDRAFT_755010 [Peniophora sp. CONT]
MPSTYPGCPDQSPYPPGPPLPLPPPPPQMPAPAPAWDPNAPYIPQGQYRAPPLQHASTAPLPPSVLGWQDSPPLDRTPSEHRPFSHLERSYTQPSDQHSRQPSSGYGEAMEYFHDHPAQHSAPALVARDAHFSGHGPSHVSSPNLTPFANGQRQVPYNTYPQQPGYPPPDGSPNNRFQDAGRNVITQQFVAGAFRGGMPTPVHEPAPAAYYDNAATLQNHTTSDPTNEIRQRAPQKKPIASLSIGRTAAGNPDPNCCRLEGCMYGPISLPNLGRIEWCSVDHMRAGTKAYKLKPCKGGLCNGTNPRGRSTNYCSEYCH